MKSTWNPLVIVPYSRHESHGGETMAQSDPQECHEEGQQRCGILQDHPTAPRSQNGESWRMLGSNMVKLCQIQRAQACWLKHWDSDCFFGVRKMSCDFIIWSNFLWEIDEQWHVPDGCRFAKNLREHRSQLNLGESEIKTNLMNTTCFDHWLDTSIASRLPPSGIPLDVRSRSVCGWSRCSRHEMLEKPARI